MKKNHVSRQVPVALIPPKARHEIRGHLELKNIYFSSTDGIFGDIKGGDEEMKEGGIRYVVVDDGHDDCGILWYMLVMSIIVTIMGFLKNMIVFFWKAVGKPNDVLDGLYPSRL